MRRRGLQGRVSVRIQAPAERVWEMVTDLPRMGEWSPENLSGHWRMPATGPVLGARFKGRNRRGKSGWSTVAEVVVADPGGEFGFRVGTRKPCQWLYVLTPTGDGGCEVSESFEIPRYSWFDTLMTRLTVGATDRKADLIAGCEETLRRLKAAAELG